MESIAVPTTASEELVMATEQEMRDAIDDSAYGLEELASMYRAVLRSNNANLIRYTYERVVESEEFFNEQADRMKADGFDVDEEQ